MSYHYSIKELPADDRPRERMLKAGSSVLTNAELFAILIGGGYQEVSAIQLSQQLLNDNGGLAGLTRLSLRDLMKIKGIGLAKAASMKAAMELGRRIASMPAVDKPAISSPEDAAALLVPKYGDRDQEHVGILALDVKNRVLQEKVITIGILDGSVIHPREIFKPALSANAASILLFHNHPSGDTSPSGKDIEVTKRIVEAGETLGITLVDHLIISRNSYLSLKQKGHM